MSRSAISSPTCTHMTRLQARRRLLASGEGRRPTAPGQARRQERRADPRREDGPRRGSTRERLARQTCACRAADLVPRIAVPAPSPAGRRRRLDRPPERNRLELIPAPTTPEPATRRRRGRGSTRPSDLSQAKPARSSLSSPYRVQRPHEKINHGLVLGGLQGIGKDTLLEPVKRAVGPWNLSRRRRYRCLAASTASRKSVVLRISEAKDMGEFDRFKFYDHMKTFLASPPDVIRARRADPARAQCLQCLLPDPDHQPQARRYLPAGGRPPALTSPGATPPGPTSAPTIGTLCGAGTSPAASATSPPISPRSTFLASTQRRRRQKHWRFGRSSRPGARRRTLSSKISLTGSATPMRPPSYGSRRQRRTPNWRRGYGTGKTGG